MRMGDPNSMTMCPQIETETKMVIFWMAFVTLRHGVPRAARSIARCFSIDAPRS